MKLFAHETKMKPILKWAGGKSGSLPQLIDLFPDRFNRYFEPFAGGAAVFLSLDSKMPAIINDSNAELIELYQVVRDAPSELMAELDRLFVQYSEKFYYSIRSTSPTDKIERAARMVFLNKTGFNGLYRLNSKGGFNVPYGKRVKCPALYKKENLLAVSERLRSTRILNLGFEEVIAQAQAGDFVYCDPPYHPVSPTASFTSYTAGGFTRKSQKTLREVCEHAVTRGVTVAISNSSANFIKELYHAWDVRLIPVKRTINSKGTQRGEVDEILAISGYSPAKLPAPIRLDRKLTGNQSASQVASPT